MNILRSLIVVAALLLAIPAAADGQYVPVQPGHAGNWSDPGAVGEGIDLSIVETEGGGREVFVTVYLLTSTGPTWLAAGGAWSSACVRDECNLVAYQRPAVGAPAVAVGTLTVLAGYTGLGIVLDADQLQRAATLRRITRPSPTPVGVCNWNGFHPRPPQAPEGWCHP